MPLLAGARCGWRGEGEHGGGNGAVAARLLLARAEGAQEEENGASGEGERGAGR
jgi:hypothetical protein